MTVFDERFLNHRRQSTSAMGIIGGILATVLWSYDYFFEHRWNWGLFAIAVTMVAVKLSLMAWYRLND